MATPWLNKGWAHGDNVRACGMVMISRSGIDRRRESAHRDEGDSAEGGRRRSPEVGFPNLQSSPAFWPQTFLQNTLGDLTSPANSRHS